MIKQIVNIKVGGLVVDTVSVNAGTSKESILEHAKSNARKLGEHHKLCYLMRPVTCVQFEYGQTFETSLVY